MGFLDTSARIRRSIINEIGALPEDYRRTFAKALTDFGLGATFCTDETGEMRRYERIMNVPGYRDLGDSAAPLTMPNLRSRGAHIIELMSGATLQEEFDVIAGGSIQRVAVSGELANTDLDASDYIQQRLDTAAALVAKVGFAAVVVLPIGRFYIDKMIKMPAGVSLEGTLGTTLDITRGTMKTGILALKTDGTRVANLKLYGSGQGSQPTNGIGLKASDVENAGSGIIFAGVNRGRIENVIVENCGGDTGKAPYNGVAGIWLTYGCTNCVVEKSYVTHCRNGINEDNFFGADPRSNKIINNIVEFCRFGIALDSALNAADTLVMGNSVKSCQQSGIDLNKAQRSRTIGNYVFGCGIESGNSGIFLYGTGGNPALHNLIAFNQVYSCLGHGIKIGPFAYHNNVLGNTCLTNAKNGIFGQGILRWNNINDNICQDNGLSGIELRKPDNDNNAVITNGSVAGNQCVQNKQHGILLDGVARMTLVGNTTQDNGKQATNVYDGIRLTNTSIENIISANHSSGADQRFAIAFADEGSVRNIVNGNGFMPCATGSTGFAGLTSGRNQFWGENGDGYTGIAGKPAGTFANGTRIYNNGDQCLYIQGTGGMRKVVTVAA